MVSECFNQKSFRNSVQSHKDWCNELLERNWHHFVVGLLAHLPLATREALLERSLVHVGILHVNLDECLSQLGSKVVVVDVAQFFVPGESLQPFVRVLEVKEDRAFLLALCPVGSAHHLLNLAGSEVSIDRKYADEGRNCELYVKAARKLFPQVE